MTRIRQYRCASQFIHRPKNRDMQQLQCPACGQKIDCYDNEDHTAVERSHQQTCRVVNKQDLQTYD